MENNPIKQLELYLIRHAESRANAGLTVNAGVIEGDNAPLTERGRRQAERLGEALSTLSFDVLISSGLTRALETAERIAEHQGKKTEIEVHPIFTECGVRDEYPYTGFDEIKAKFPLCVPFPGDDGKTSYIYAKSRATDEENLARAKKALSGLLGRFSDGESVAAVSHGAFLTSLMYAAMGLCADAAFDLRFDNTGITKLIFFKKGTGPYGKDVHLMYHNRQPEADI